MTAPDRWHTLDRLFHDALACDEQSRALFVRNACDGDEALQRELESLLAYSYAAREFMAAPALEVAAASIRPATSASSLIGLRLGPYEIRSLLGAGGMGDVYRARDLTLDRDVAIKVLPEAFTVDAERRARFEREARLLAALNHPHIGAIYGVEHREGIHGLILELAEGTTLAERLRDGPLPVGEALAIARQIADALDAAHEKGIVHRDLKPANIAVTRQGVVKVLDFGLAKISADQSGPTVSRSPTVTVAATNVGVILGTAAYMSPEQARGQVVDKRTDIWAFGCVLYEALTGRRAFRGETGTDVLAALIEREPDWSALPGSTPPAIHRLLQRCLAKDPTRRLRDIGEARIELDDALATARHGERRSKPTRLVIGSAASLAVVVLASVWLWFGRTRPAARDSAEYVPLTNFADSVVSPALSPDGRLLAFIRGQSTFVGPGQVYVKLLPDGEPVQLTHDDFFKLTPAFSPDGARIAYTVSRGPSDWNTWVVPVLGGQPSQMLANATGLTWVRADANQPRILFSELRGDGIHMAVMTSTESRSSLRDVYVPPSEQGMAHRSTLSPDGKWILVVEMDQGTWLPCRLVSYKTPSLGSRVGPAPAQCTDAAWSPDGRWMYFSANAGRGFHIWRQRFPDGVVQEVTSGATEEEGLALASDGRSVVTSIGTSQSTVWMHDALGERQISSQGYAMLPSFSTDGGKLYYLLRSGGSRHFVSGELWAADLGTGQRERVLPDFLMENYAISADGRRVVFVVADAAGNSPVWLATLDRRFAPRRLTSINASRALFRTESEVIFLGEERGSRFVYRVRDDGSGLQKVFPNPVLFLYSLSADGKWIAAWVPGSTEETRNSLVAYPIDGGSPVTICICATAGGPDRGHLPPLVSWSPDGKFLYLLAPGRLRSTYAVPLRSGKALPDLPPSGVQSEKDVAALSGARLISQQQVFAGPSPSVYAFSRVTVQRNIYRIPVRY